MLIRFISKVSVISIIAIVGNGATYAQSTVQCTLGPTGQLQAALVWRNTLGTERADALCRTASMSVTQQNNPPATTVQHSMQQQYPVQQQKLAVAPVQYQPVMQAPTTPIFSPSDYEPMLVQNMASLQSISPEFVPMFQR